MSANLSNNIKLYKGHEKIKATMENLVLSKRESRHTRIDVQTSTKVFQRKLVNNDSRIWDNKDSRAVDGEFESLDSPHFPLLVPVL